MARTAPLHGLRTGTYTAALRDSREMCAGRVRDDGTEFWRAYNSDTEVYDRTFGNVLGGDTILGTANDRSSLVVVDLMSSAAAIRSLFNELEDSSRAHGVSVTKGENRTKEQQAADTHQGIHQIIGDISRVAPWVQLAKVMRQQKADLIFARPVAGVYYLPRHRLFFEITLQRIWNMLSPEGGTALLQVPDSYMLTPLGIDMSEWISTLGREGIVSSYSTTSVPVETLLISKTPGSPELLPTTLR